MFGPDHTAGCSSCSAIADWFNGVVAHLANHDVTLSAVSPAPLANLQVYNRRMGVDLSYSSSPDSDFNFHLTEEQKRKGVVQYSYRRDPWDISHPEETVEAASSPPARVERRPHGKRQLRNLPHRTGKEPQPSA